MIRFGVFTFQALPFAALLDDVSFIEQLGLDAVWLADQAVPAGMPILEAWTALAGLAAATDRIRLGTNVTNVAMRNPVIVARQATTVDNISAGRLDVGLGSGYYDIEQRSLGIDYPDAKGRVRRLIEATEIIDQAMRGNDVTYSGEWFHLDGAVATPPPVQQPRPPIWLAAHAMGSMRLAARLAEGMASFGDHGLKIAETLPAFRERMARADEVCAFIGRDPKTLRRSYLAGFADEAVFSSREAAADFVGAFAEAGATDFIFTFFNPAVGGMDAGAGAVRYAGRAQLEELATQVVPRYR